MAHGTRRLGIALVAASLSVNIASVAQAVDATASAGVRKTHAQMVQDVIDGHIIPRVAQLHDVTVHLADDVKTFCAAPQAGADAKAKVDQSFQRTVTAWGDIDFVRFGPIAEASRLERFFFWPDPRGTTERQLQALLAKRDEALLAPGALRAQSAAVQGLSALEFLIFSDTKPISGADDEARFRCAFAAAIAANLESIAGEIETGWIAPQLGWRAKMLAPGSDNPVYKDASETAREIVKALLTGLQIAQDRNVLPRLQAALAQPPKKIRLAFERSGMSNRYLGQELASLAAFFDATGLLAFVPPEKAWMKAFIPRAFETLVADAPLLSRAESDDEKITRLRKMRFSLNGLRQIVSRELAPGADIVLGFNELDGD
jgi:predicted lipoprotein